MVSFPSSLLVMVVVMEAMVVHVWVSGWLTGRSGSWEGLAGVVLFLFIFLKKDFFFVAYSSTPNNSPCFAYASLSLYWCWSPTFPIGSSFALGLPSGDLFGLSLGNISTPCMGSISKGLASDLLTHATCIWLTALADDCQRHATAFSLGKTNSLSVNR